MAWIIASGPFWLLGGFSVFVAVWGGYLCIKEDRTREDSVLTAYGFLVFMVLAGIFFAIAAKVAS